MRQLLTQLYVTSEDAYLSLDGHRGQPQKVNQAGDPTSPHAGRIVCFSHQCKPGTHE